MPRPVHSRRRRRLGGREDDHHPRARARARRGPRRPHLHRRLPPLRPQAARRARDHPAAPGLQLPRHHRPASRSSPRGARRSSSPSTATRTARSDRPCTCRPERFTLIEGLLGYYLPEMRDVYDVRVFLNPPEELRRRWKVQRDCSRRGYTTDQVLAELDRREPDSEAFIRPQRRHADMLVSFVAPRDDDAVDQTHLDAELTLLRRAAASGPDAVRQRRARRAATGRATTRERDPPHPGPDGSRARGRDRGGDLGAHALRHPPARAPPRRVHGRYRATPLASRWRSCSC